MTLADGDAKPRHTILQHRHSLPITAIIPLFRGRHFVPASIAITALLAEFLIITLAGLPYRPGQLRNEFLFCAIFSLIVLFIMLVQLAVVSIWRRGLPHLPRRPDTVAAVMTYIAGAAMNRDFDGLEHSKPKERDRIVAGLGKTYFYGLGGDKSGVRQRYVVDEVAPGMGDNSVQSGSDTERRL